MQQILTRKAEVQDVITSLCQNFASNDIPQFWNTLTDDLLSHKVKFPILEFVAQSLYNCISLDDQLSILTGLFGKPEHGSSVIAGKLLQLHLPHNLPEAFTLATEGIIRGDKWYHCDHLGERVFGHGLLTAYPRAFPLLTDTLQHKNHWIRRAVGVATHYATKKGLPVTQVESTLTLLLSQADTRDYQVQRGLGWGLKTIAKFHPQLMRTHLASVPNEAISLPILRKIETGLATADKIGKGSG